MEALFKKEKYPVCVRRNYIQWTKFCEYLTEHYKGILPKGYVFRLPTEAELEWAMVADENGDVCNLGDQFDDAQPGYREAMVRLLEKKHFSDVKHFDTVGFYRECYIGGRSSANAWGMCDFRFDKMCLDLMDADRRIDPAQIDSREKDYDEDWRGCHTDKELTPWVQIELDSCRAIAGLQIELFRLRHLARHLRVWVSDGSKEMRLVAEEDRMPQRFRFDLRGKTSRRSSSASGASPVS